MDKIRHCNKPHHMSFDHENSAPLDTSVIRIIVKYYIVQNNLKIFQ